MKLEIFTDGACSGNPGPASIGVVIKKEGETVGEISQSIGNATNNIAEYTAVVYALQEALIRRADEVNLATDSELLFKQLQGVYEVKNENILPLYAQIQHLKKGFKSLVVRHVPRELNKEADRLAQKAVVKKSKEQTKVVASQLICGEESPSSKG